MKFKAKQTYLKGKSVFIISTIVIGITILTVFLTGSHYHRTISSNLYLSLAIIATALFLFMTYGLYQGIGLIDDFPKIERFKGGDVFAHSTDGITLPDIDVGEGIGGLLLSILLWVLVSVLFVVLLIVLEFVFWLSLFLIIAMLYWVFFRALKFVFGKSKDTKDNLGISAVYGLTYTLLYTGWIFGIIYASEQLQ